MMSQIKSVKLWDWLAQICQKEQIIYIIYRGE